MKKKIIELPLKERITVYYEIVNEDVVIKEVMWKGIEVYDLLLACNNFDGFNIVGYIFERI